MNPIAFTIFLLNILQFSAQLNVTIADDGATEIWGPILEEWTTNSKREQRVMQYIPANKYLIEDDPTDRDDKESKINVGKVVNEVHKPQTPQRRISETDLYLLNAIEKLVHRMDYLEKRLHTVEEMLYYFTAGNRVDQEPCPSNFTRTGAKCHYFSIGHKLNWKDAKKFCQKLSADLTELKTIEDNQDVVEYILKTSSLRGRDYWTGGLNPGLLWIWSTSARPVSMPGAKDKEIKGDGRCLSMSYDQKTHSYQYKGKDCAFRHEFICELPENDASNQIRRLGRDRKIID